MCGRVWSALPRPSCATCLARTPSATRPARRLQDSRLASWLVDQGQTLQEAFHSPHLCAAGPAHAPRGARPARPTLGAPSWLD